MTLGEKVAYLKGLLDGMNNDDKIVKLMADILADMAESIEACEADIDALGDVIDEIDNDLGEVEEVIYDIDEDDCGCGHHHHHDDDCDCEDMEFDDYEDCEDIYEVTCPTCSETICLDETLLDAGSLKCPNCGELLEFDLDEDQVEE